MSLVSASAGISQFESPAAEYKALKSLSLDDLIVGERKSSTYFVRAQGDSMTGVGIYDGDLLVIDRACIPRHGDVVVATHDGLFVVKLLDLHQKRLISANEEYAPVAINSASLIEGVVVQSIRCHRPITS
ncbi:LexA family protein [Vibrio renipiscarius]|uniref:DNA polymerase V n=1 Tax=Vibrio renipiscarius TaxID=1461322 RepID=A0A0C2K2H9_9VIBR|nr:S24 family peptidase [Vibrio renipiscarius]KII76138.1 DNA polymerase V [Vibrio renipiscarius]KII78524.1 DNA polymerase V [Vibrio renipiscarius]